MHNGQCVHVLAQRFRYQETSHFREWYTEAAHTSSAPDFTLGPTETVDSLRRSLKNDTGFVSSVIEPLEIDVVSPFNDVTLQEVGTGCVLKDGTLVRNRI